MAKKRNILLLVSGTIVVFLTAAFFVLYFMLFDSEPLKLKRNTANPFSIIVKISDLRKTLRDAVPHQEKTLVFTAEEVNYGLSIASAFISGKIQKQLDNDSVADIIMKDGIFCGVFNYPVRRNFINVSVQLGCAWNKKKLSYELISAHAGRFPISETYIEKQIEFLLKKHFYGQPVEQVMRDAIHSVTINKNQVFVVYEPYALVESVEKNFFRDSGKFKKLIGAENE